MRTYIALFISLCLFSFTGCKNVQVPEGTKISVTTDQGTYDVTFHPKPTTQPTTAPGT